MQLLIYLPTISKFDDRQTVDSQREQFSSSILIRCCDTGLIRCVY